MERSVRDRSVRDRSCLPAVKYTLVGTCIGVERRGLDSEVMERSAY
jgi:hypothetical protein